MGALHRPHLLGIDDGPVDKASERPVVLVGVVMEGADLVEGVAVTRFPVDGAEVTSFLSDWVTGLRFHAGLQGVILGGVTIAGLGVVDVGELATRLGVPVLVVNRRDPSNHRVGDALHSAGLMERFGVLERAPAAEPLEDGLYLACSGISRNEAARLVQSARRKSDLPEPLRLAHMIARAITTGESRGRP